MSKAKHIDNGKAKQPHSLSSVLVMECLVIILVLNWLFKDRETPLFARKKGVDLV